jgi:hypothetical protein
MTEAESEKLNRIEAKLDVLLESVTCTKIDKNYLSAKEVAKLIGLNYRTVLNRSNLDRDDPRYIPSIRFGSNRKYFERKVIERIFSIKS